ncbi:hypothetical protein [Sphingobacterium multivorum]|uniref:hypothetical protein n=1 Tax=Sphingobacterium multivorum TaxID=28454 RepID=UPI0028AD5346|nr:hypothetical protein [Sphingobacterium multivorum]
MKKTMHMIGAFGFAAILLSACNQEFIAEQPISKVNDSGGYLPPTGTEQNSVGVKAGFLVFPNMEVFNNTIKTLQSGKDLENWEGQFKNYESFRNLRQKYESTKEGFAENPLMNMDMPDRYFRTILSSTGRIQIADTLYQFEPEKDKVIAYAIPVRQADEIINGKLPAASAKGVVTYFPTISLMPFPRWEDNPVHVDDPQAWNVCDFPNAFLLPWWGQKGGSIYHDDNGVELPRDNGRRIRIDYHRWRVGYVFYSSIGVRVKIYKDTRLAGWLSNIRMDKVSMEACTKGKIITPGLFPVNFSENTAVSGSNTNELERTLKWSSAPMHTEVVPEHFNFHFKAYFRTKPVERYIRE